MENAYGRLKARWRRPLKRNDMHVNKIPIVIAAACVLHNICEIHREAFNDAWLSEEVSGSTFPQPSTVTHHAVLGNRAKQIRDTLVYYFNYCVCSDITVACWHCLKVCVYFKCIFDA